MEHDTITLAEARLEALEIDEYVRLIARLDDVIASLVRLMFKYHTAHAQNKLLKSIDRHLDHRLRLMAKRDMYL